MPEVSEPSNRQNSLASQFEGVFAVVVNDQMINVPQLREINVFVVENLA